MSVLDLIHTPGTPTTAQDGPGATEAPIQVISYAVRCEFDAWRALTPREQRRILDRVAQAVSEEVERTKDRDAILERLRAGARRERYYQLGEGE